LKQKKGQPSPLASQVAIIWAATNGFLDEVDNEKVGEFEERLLEDLRLKAPKVLSSIEKTKVLSDDDVKALEKIVNEVVI